MDFTKAYDQVSHKFLAATLICLGLTSRFTHLVGMLYFWAPSFFLVNGNRSASFEVKRGICQGRPFFMR